MDENAGKIMVFGYVRVSTSGQVREGYSLDQQKEEIIKFCQDNDYNLIKMYEDAGISGAKVDEDDMSIDRPGLQSMLADITQVHFKKLDSQHHQEEGITGHRSSEYWTTGISMRGYIAMMAFVM